MVRIFPNGQWKFIYRVSYVHSFMSYKDLRATIIFFIFSTIFSLSFLYHKGNDLKSTEQDDNFIKKVDKLSVFNFDRYYRRSLILGGWDRTSKKSSLIYYSLPEENILRSFLVPMYVTTLLSFIRSLSCIINPICSNELHVIFLICTCSHNLMNWHQMTF